MFLVRSGAVSGFDTLLRSFHVNPIQLIHESGLSDAQFRDPNSYISYTKMALLLEKCAIKCEVPLFGLRLADRHDRGVLGDLPMTISQEPTVGKALAELDRYIYLYANGVHIKPEKHKAKIKLNMSFDFQTELGLNQLLQLSVAHLANITARLMGVNSYSLPIHLKQAMPKEVKSNHLPYPKTHFSSTFDGLLLPAEALLQKTNQDETEIQLHFQQQLSYLKEKYPENLQNQVQAVIGQLLPSGECCIETVAANLDLHPRMLQLKLQEENTNYRDILIHTRKKIAEQHLSQSAISITSLALNLGFSDVAVFSRSFKAWTGLSPKVWRIKNKEV